MTVYIVNTPNQVASLLNDIENQPTKPPSLYLDIEGVSLSRHGSISIIQLYNAPHSHVYLIDIFVLQQAAFDTPNWSGITLRSVLESKSIPKVFFDVRNDSDALFAHFKISLGGCYDVQLSKAATQPWVKRLTGLGQCIKQDAQLSVDALEDWQTVKAKGTKLFSPESGGSYEVFNVRPLLQDIITYCAQDVIHLPILWSTYSEKLFPSWLRRVKAETAKRVISSQAESYDPHGNDKVWSPWAKNVKDKNRKGSKRGSGKQNEGNGLHAIEYQEPKERLSLGQSINTKLAHRQAEKLPSLHSSFPASVGNTEPETSKRVTNVMGLYVNKAVPKIEHDPTFSHTVLPTRNKCKTKAEPVGQVHNKLQSPVTSTTWICNTCNRMTLQSQKEAHLAGKAHIARVKEVAGEVDSSPTAKTSPTEKKGAKKKAKAKAKNAPERAILGVTGSKGTQQRARAAVTSTYPPYEPYGNADCGFVGFSHGYSRSGSGQYGCSLGGGGDDYGLCDKDCGWCGHCMDGVDI